MNMENDQQTSPEWQYNQLIGKRQPIEHVDKRLEIQRAKLGAYVSTPKFYKLLYSMNPVKTEVLISQQIRGSGNALAAMSKQKAVTVNELTKIFTLGKDFEYYCGKQALTKWLLGFQEKARVEIRSIT